MSELDSPNTAIFDLFVDLFGGDLGVQNLSALPPPAASNSFRSYRVVTDYLAQAEQAPKVQNLVPRTTPIRHALSGFGRRNSLLLIYIGAVVANHYDRFQKLGLKLHFTIYERQSQDEAGSGYSCQTMSDGAFNTGVPGPVSIPQVNNLAELPPKIRVLTDLAGHIVSGLQDNIPAHQTALRTSNLAALEMFSEALQEGGGIKTSDAFTTRGAVGRIQQPAILEALDYIDAELNKVLTVTRCFEHDVVALDLQNPRKPRLTVVSRDKQEEKHEFDFVHLANGTAGVPSLPPSLGNDRVYSEAPNNDALFQFLQGYELIAPGGREILPHSRIEIAGFSLSAFDFVPLILQHTPLLVSTDSGYEIDEARASEYQGLLTFLSRDGLSTLPRIIYKSDCRSILSTKELHALFLQTNYDWMAIWRVFLDAHVARGLKATPRRDGPMDPGIPSRQMADYAKQTTEHKCGKATEVGLIRAGYARVYFGQGFDEDPDQAERDLVAMAPLTRHDRAGYFMRRGCLSDVTSLNYINSTGSNAAFIREFMEMYRCYAGPPTPIHNLVARMFQLGVAQHTSQPWHEIVHDPKVAYIGPQFITRKADTVFTSSTSQVKEVISGQPEYGKGRFLLSHTNDAVHALEMGMGGHGTRILTGATKAESIVGMRWVDTNALGPAVHSASIVASMTVLLSVISAQGEERPADRLLDYYNKNILPTPGDFRKEVQLFESVWREVHEKHAFLKLCEAAATNGETYFTYTEHVFDPEKRQSLVSSLESTHGVKVEEYRQAIAKIPVFEPPTVSQYMNRFVDFTPSEIQQCWEGLCPQ